MKPLYTTPQVLRLSRFFEQRKWGKSASWFKKESARNARRKLRNIIRSEEFESI